MAAVVKVPVSVGLADRTKLVVPVEPETSEIEETKLANEADVPRSPPTPDVTKREAVRPLKVILPLEVKPVKLVNVPAIVELPVTPMPPLETVKVVTVGLVAITALPVPVVAAQLTVPALF